MPRKKISEDPILEAEKERIKKKRTDITVKLEGKKLTADYSVLCLFLEVLGMAVKYQRLQKHVGLVSELEKIENELDIQIKGALR